MNLRKNILVITVLILAILVVPAAAQNSEENIEEKKSKVAAYVNQDKISENELKQFAGTEKILLQLLQINQEFASVLMRSESGQKVLNEFNKLKLEQLITSKLLVEKAKDRGIEVGDQEMNNIFNQLLDAFKQRNNYNEEQLEDAIKERGYESVDQYKEIFFENNRNGFLVNKLRENIISDVEVTEAETKEFYDNNKGQFEKSEQKKVSHILFKNEDKAEKILDKIKAGAEFSAMAEEYSIGPTAENGGNMGFISFNNQGLDKTFLKAAMELEVGEVSETPLKTEYGYHLIKVTDFKAVEVVPFADVKDNIKNQMRSQKQRESFQNFIEKLREDAEIEIKI